MKRIRRGDLVAMIAGKDKGKSGVVLRKVGASHVLVEGLNLAKKHVKPNPMKGVSGGIMEKEMLVHVSNLSLLSAETHTTGRIGFLVRENNNKVRVFKSNGEVVG